MALSRGTPVKMTTTVRRPLFASATAEIISVVLV